MASPMPPTPTMAEVQSILCPICHKSNLRRARFCQHCGYDVVLNNDGPRYYITRVIKAGGQGAVYEAIGDDGHVYAVKEMLDRFTDPKERDEAISRFEAEAKILERLSHPRIPRVYTDFKDEGRHYLAMDFVQGEDLEEILKREGALPENQVLEWADQICDVLDYLHKNGLIYRDMKPSNIMIDHKNGGIKMVDFGIAKVFQRAERGTQIGTPGYAPPEQYQGIATPESDLYALGATLHHMLTGRDPRDEPPFSFPPVYGLNPRVSKRTSDAILRALQMKPEDRYQSVAELRAALRPDPPQAPQVRVTPQTKILQPQPQVAATVAAPTVPSTASPAGSPATTAKPAAPSAKPVQKPPKHQPAPSMKPAKRPWRWLVGLLMIVLIGMTLVFAFPDLFTQMLSGSGPQSQPTPQTLVAQPFTVTNLEIIVPNGVDVNEAFRQAFVKKAQEQHGPGTIVNFNAPPTYVGGPPEKLNETSQGAHYRASMQGVILVPK